MSIHGILFENSNQGLGKLICIGVNLKYPYHILILKYLQESLLHMNWIERLSSLSGHGEHWNNVVMPKDPVGRINLGNVAKQTLGVDLGQYQVVLQVAQAVQKELKKQQTNKENKL